MTPGEEKAQERFLGGYAKSLGAKHAMENVYRGLAPHEQQSFHLAWTASQNDGANSIAVAAGLMLGGVASFEGLVDPASDSWYLAWGKGLMYGAQYSRGAGEAVKSQPSFIRVENIGAIQLTDSQGLDRLHFVAPSGQELFFFTLTRGPKLRVYELAELLDVPLNKGKAAIDAPTAAAAQSPSWERLRGAIRQQFAVQIDEPDALRLVFDVGDGRTQAIAVERRTFEDEEWVEISTDVASEGQLDYRDALALSGSLVVGGLILRDGIVVYRHVVPLDGFDAMGVGRLFNHVTRFGDALESATSSGEDFVQRP